MMPTVDWTIRRLGECVEFLSGGTPSKRNAAFWGGDIPWVSCKDMKVDRIYDAEDHLTEEGAKNGTRIVEPGTILLVVRGMILAKELPVAITRRRVAFNQDLKALRCAPWVDDKFIFYWLKANSYEILGIADEAAHGTKRLQTDRLQDLLVRLPSIHLQRKIADILSAYDDLIENNTRRIAILEEMARALYREWFVKFRFPGHEGVRLVESPVGPIPEGWEVRALADVANITMGQSPSSEYYNRNGVGLPFHQGVSDFGDWFPVDRVYCTVQNRVAEAGDILFSVRAPVGRMNLANKRIVIGRGLSAIRSKYGNQEFLFQQLKERFHEEDLIGGGSIFKAVTRDDMHRIPIIVPTDNLDTVYQVHAAPMFKQIACLTSAIDILRRTRDLLLPKLVSGEIDVSEMFGEMDYA